MTAHPNDGNSLLSRLTSVNIKFEDEVQGLFLLSSIPDGWDRMVRTVSSLGNTNWTFKGVRDLILREDIHRKNSGESTCETGSLLCAGVKGRKLRMLEEILRKSNVGSVISMSTLGVDAQFQM